VSGAQLFWSRSARVFDLDGTLVDTLPDLARALNAALLDLGLPPVPAPLVRQSLHMGIEGSVDAALQSMQAPAALHDLLLARYHVHYDDTPALLSRPFPGVHELLQRLQARGDRLAVCTNKPQVLAQRVLGMLGLAPFFGTVVGADTCDHSKPHPAPLLHAIGALGASRAQTLLVGDSAVDLACAEAAGVDCLLFAGGYGDVTHPHRFDSWTQLLQREPLPARHRLQEAR
jgi:phosphoglycolate phosphatase